MKDKIGLYGGSFDPIHVGHIKPVLEAKSRLKLDRIVYLPTAEPPHKPDRAMAPAHNRFAMVELALLDYPELLVSAFELTPDRTAYTVDSAEHFADLDPGSEFFLIVGSDSFRELESWHRWRDLVSICRLAVLARSGEEARGIAAGLSPDLAELLESGWASLVENEPVEASSTQLRDLFASGNQIPEEMMPRRVVEYIRKYSLYS